jgi:hypothetical protein
VEIARPGRLNRGGELARFEKPRRREIGRSRTSMSVSMPEAASVATTSARRAFSYPIV